jgi:N-acetylglucosamine transport system permease protein
MTTLLEKPPVELAAAAPRHVARPRRPLHLSRAAIYLLLLSYLVIVVYPMFWLLATSLKPDQEIFLHPFSLPDLHHLDWVNFSRAWFDAHLGDYFFNSLIITVGSVAVTLLLASTTACALSRYQFRLAAPLLYFFIAGLMIPLQLTIVPLFFQMKQWHLLDNRLGLLLAYIGFGLPFAVFVLAGFYRGLPRSLEEAARLDGCSELQVYRYVILPLGRPGMITVAIFLILGNWNEYFVAFICLSGREARALRTMPLGLANITIISQYRSDWGVAFAGLVLVMLPTIVTYAFLQKHLTAGLTTGAVKG